MNSKNTHISAVKEYYGKILNSKNDLKTTACCPSEALPAYLKEIVNQIDHEVTSKFYGCGVPIPAALNGTKVLDLGCGTGRDCFILSKLVGPHGQVIGIDMTTEQLEVAQRHLPTHTQTFGYEHSNIRFVHGYIEDLKSADIADQSIDVIVSNCVINLSPDKSRVFSEAFRVLKPGGELYFSDVFCDRRLPDNVRHDSVLLGECLGGALYIEDFRRLLYQLGCRDFRIVKSAPISITNEDLKQKVGGAKFFSLTVRAFHLALEDRCEDYGEVAYYLGGVAECPHSFALDDHHIFERNRPLLVCSNTADMLKMSRFAPYFKIEGDRHQHFGLFDCGTPSFASDDKTSGACC